MDALQEGYGSASGRTISRFGLRRWMASLHLQSSCSVTTKEALATQGNQLVLDTFSNTTSTSLRPSHRSWSNASRCLQRTTGVISSQSLWVPKSFIARSPEWKWNHQAAFGGASRAKNFKIFPPCAAALGILALASLECHVLPPSTSSASLLLLLLLVEEAY